MDGEWATYVGTQMVRTVKGVAGPLQDLRAPDIAAVWKRCGAKGPSDATLRRLQARMFAAEGAALLRK